MLCSPARTGRDRQRYEDQFRLVAGCIPYRFEKVDDNFCDIEKRLLVLMISSPNRDNLVFPKGGWEDDESVTEAACREALEEAGVKGILREEPLGDWEFRSKSTQNSCSVGGGCRGYMFALEVTEELDCWPEQDTYERKWLTKDDAFKFCRYDWMRDALKRLITVLSEGETEGGEEEEEEEEETREDQAAEFSPPILSISDARAHQKLSPVCFGTPSSGVQHLDDSCSKCIVLG
ncbi:nudix hydrolase 13, mitochondrial-like [Rhododendron vialii]|uniref:nudix hydrolase 13, mitochondrial-like n=1 Tax=Rhododendron vialii TaxID=182163 RepID=UPI00265D7943|nr:nudix hydrolase 13, mitochondrial-like [Rhododendron vialii]